MTQGDLIVSAKSGKPQSKFARNKPATTSGEKSYEGIVAKKLAGKAAIASESVQRVTDASPDSKGGDLVRSPEPWKRSNETMRNHCDQTEAGEAGRPKNRGRTLG